MTILLAIFHQGLIFSLVALSVHITSRIIKLDDLSVEGSFGLSGAVTAYLISINIAAPLVILASILAGLFLGFITGVLYTKVKMNHLLAGLVSTTAAFSLSLWLASANKIVERKSTIFSTLPFVNDTIEESLWLFSIAALLSIFFIYFFKTSYGLLLTAVGENPAFFVKIAKNKSNYQILGFILANSITALAASLFVQWSGFFSITGNIGTLVTGLTSLMIAELFSKKPIKFLILAGMIYQGIFALIIFIGITPIWNNLMKAILIISLVMITKIINKKGELNA